MTAEYRLSTQPISDEAAEGRAKELLEGARAKLGFVPNMYRGMAIVPGVLDSYLYGYDLFRKGSFTAPEQEVVFLTISKLNDCRYCTAAHSMLAVNVSKLSEADTYAIRDDQPLSNAKLQALHDFTKVMFDSRGLPSIAQAEAFKAAGYSDAQILEIVLAISVKTISNYSNHVNHSKVDPQFAAFKVAEAA